ncbi:hypothetical protein MRX96_054414 [Rhipicephalus microplus]
MGNPKRQMRRVDIRSHTRLIRPRNAKLSAGGGIGASTSLPLSTTTRSAAAPAVTGRRNNASRDSTRSTKGKISLETGTGQGVRPAGPTTPITTRRGGQRCTLAGSSSPVVSRYYSITVGDPRRHTGEKASASASFPAIRYGPDLGRSSGSPVPLPAISREAHRREKQHQSVREHVAVRVQNRTPRTHARGHKHTRHREVAETKKGGERPGEDKTEERKTVGGAADQNTQRMPLRLLLPRQWQGQR